MGLEGLPQLPSGCTCRGGRTTPHVRGMPSHHWGGRVAWEDGETLAVPAAWLLVGAGPGETPQPSHFSYGVAWCQLGPPGRLG